MVARLQRVVACGLALLLPIWRALASEASLSARIDEYVRTEMARQKIPGLGLAVVRKGEVLHAKGYGLANLEHDVPVTTDTLFQSGSVGKQFTAALTLRLIEEGKLGLNDPVRRYFPDAPATWQPITVRHLLTHTSGIPDYEESFDFQRNVTEAELVRYAFGLKLEFPAGARWNYSNTGYVILGFILQQVGGHSYAEMMRDRIFLPVGMKTARGSIDDAAIVPHRAAGYQMVKGELQNHRWVAPTLGTTADGCMYFSVNDVIAWERAWRDRAVLKPESWELFLTPVKLNSGRSFPYGFGIGLSSTAGRRTEQHGGAWQGFMAHRVRYVDDDFSVFVLANLAPSNPAGIAAGVAELVQPGLMSRPPETEAAPPHDDPGVRQRVVRLLADAREGKLSPDELAYLRGGSSAVASLSQRCAEMLAGLDQPQAITFRSREDLGDDVIYVLELVWPGKRMLLRLGLAPDDKVSAFALRLQ